MIRRAARDRPTARERKKGRASSGEHHTRFDAVVELRTERAQGFQTADRSDLKSVAPKMRRTTGGSGPRQLGKVDVQNVVRKRSSKTRAALRMATLRVTDGFMQREDALWHATDRASADDGADRDSRALRASTASSRVLRMNARARALATSPTNLSDGAWWTAGIRTPTDWSFHRLSNELGPFGDA